MPRFCGVTVWCTVNERALKRELRPSEISTCVSFRSESRQWNCPRKRLARLPPNLLLPFLSVFRSFLVVTMSARKVRQDSFLPAAVLSHGNQYRARDSKTTRVNQRSSVEFDTWHDSCRVSRIAAHRSSTVSYLRIALSMGSSRPSIFRVIAPQFRDEKETLEAGR